MGGKYDWVKMDYSADDAEEAVKKEKEEENEEEEETGKGEKSKKSKKKDKNGESSSNSPEVKKEPEESKLHPAVQELVSFQKFKTLHAAKFPYKNAKLICF